MTHDREERADGDRMFVVTGGPEQADCSVGAQGTDAAFRLDSRA
ncbi:hypothetical protein [Streptomyces broussonetiae]|nr:hypothetical protein [Streptomyces broussonetiae]